MKSILSGLVLTLCCVCSLSASAAKKVKDLRADKHFVATCPKKFLTYIDKKEGGPGAYCACPDENITYIDKAEGGPGFFCAE